MRFVVCRRPMPQLLEAGARGDGKALVANGVRRARAAEQVLARLCKKKIHEQDTMSLSDNSLTQFKLRSILLLDSSVFVSVCDVHF